MKPASYSLAAIKELGKLTPDGILVFRLAEQEVVFINKSLSRILEVSGKDLKARGVELLREVFQEEYNYLVEKYRELQEKSKVLNVEFHLTGLKKYISCDGYVINKGTMLLLIVKDVTAAKEHSDYIIEFGAKKDTILDMVAHNLSGPLNITTSLLDLVDQSSRTQEYRKIDNFTRLIRENTQQCIDIINSFIREEHFVSKEIAVEAKRFDVIAKIRVIVERLLQFSPAKRITLISDHDDLFITGDDVKFFQVVHNLLSNSIKFTEDDGQIEVRVVEVGNSVRIAIEDDGIGIPEGLHAHIFKKNTPAGRPGLRGEKSIGMGLYIVRKLVHLMKGEIGFESAEGKGAVFIIQIPKA